MHSYRNRKIVRRIRFLATLVLVVCVFSSVAQAKRPPATKLLPINVVAYGRVANAKDLSKHFMNTALGRMSQDPKLNPLVKHLYGAIAEVVAEAKDQIGATLPELLSIFQGEIAVALVAPENQRPALVLLLEAGDRTPLAQKLIDKTITDLFKRISPGGAKKKEETLEGTKFVNYSIELPSDDRRPRAFSYFVKEGTIIISSNDGVLKTIHRTWTTGKGDTLSKNQRFAAIMRRCRGAKDETPQITWFVDPMEIVRNRLQQNTITRVTTMAILDTLGLKGLHGVGGSLALDTKNFDLIGHVHMLLNNPRTGVLEAIALGSGPMTPPRWVPANVSGYTTMHWDVEKVYAKTSKIFDSFSGEGALSRIMLENVSERIGVDFEKELLPSLSGRITYVDWFPRPVVNLRSGRRILGVGLKDGDAFEKMLEKIVAKQKKYLSKRSYRGTTYYQITPPQPDDAPADRPRFPQPCFAIVGDELLVSNNSSALEKAIATNSEDAKSLRDSKQYRLLYQKLKPLAAGAKPGLITFNQPEEGMRFLYELATSSQNRERLNKQAQDNRFFKKLDEALTKNPLPPFAVLSKYLAPGGALLTNDKTGFHYTIFSLRRE